MNDIQAHKKIKNATFFNLDSLVFLDNHILGKLGLQFFC
jgi:hypothetical protein